MPTEVCAYISSRFLQHQLHHPIGIVFQYNPTHRIALSVGPFVTEKGHTNAYELHVFIAYVHQLLAPQSGALRINAYRDFHPILIPSTYSF